MNVPSVLRGPADVLRVDVLQASDLKYWSRALGVSAERLVLAVDAAGDMADDVRAELRRQRPSKAPRAGHAL